MTADIAKLPAPGLQPAFALPEKVHALRYTIGLGIITLCAAILRLAALDRPMQYDEAYTYITYVSQPLRLALSDYSLPNNHLFHTLLAHFSTALCGNHPWALRLPAFLAGVAMIPAGYFLTVKCCDRLAGLFMAVLLAVNWYLIDYSTNARGYTLVALLVLLACIFAYDLLETGRWQAWAGFMTCCVLGLYTIPTTLYAFLGLVLWLLLSWWRSDAARLNRRFIRHLLAASLLAIGATGLLYLPVLLRWHETVQANHPLLHKATNSDIIAALPALLAETWIAWHSYCPFPVQLLVLAGFAVGLYAFRAQRSRYLPLALPLAIIPIPMAFIQHAMLFARIFSYVLPLYLMLVAGGFSYLIHSLYRKRPLLATWIAGIALAGLLIAWGIPDAGAIHGKLTTPENSKAIGNALAMTLRENDFYAIQGEMSVPLAYYLNRQRISVIRINTDFALELWVVTAQRNQTLTIGKGYLVLREADKLQTGKIFQYFMQQGVYYVPVPVRQLGEYTLYSLNAVPVSK